MKCSRCGIGNPDNARFCSSCGLPFSRGQGGVEPTTAIERPRTATPPVAKKGPLPWIVIAVVVLAIVGVGLFMLMKHRGSITQARDTNAVNGGQLTQAVDPNTGKPITQAPPTNIGTGLTEGGQVQGLPPAPPEVLDYLRWLRDVEARRQRLYGEMQHAIQMAAMQVGVDFTKGMDSMMNPDEPAGSEDAKKAVEKQSNALDAEVAKLGALVNEVNQRTPPETCKALHTQYSGMVNKWIGVMKQVAGAIENADFTSLPMGGQTDRDIEGAIASSEQELGAVYGRYAISDPPRFHIEDKGSTAPMTSGGGG